MRTLGGDWTEPTGRSCPAVKPDSWKRRAKVAHRKGKLRSDTARRSSSLQPDVNALLVRGAFRAVIETGLAVPKTDTFGFPWLPAP